MNNLRRAYLAGLGVDLWVARAPFSREEPDSVHYEHDAAPASSAAGSDIATLGWEALERAVARCTACSLHETRRQTVFGVGDKSARLLVVGEAPGADEDRIGEPFVGRAGQLLNAMLAAIGLDRQSVYIANILKCRPPNNRDPKPSESATCSPFLARQIELLQPRVVLALGRISAQWLLRSELPVGRLRGQMQTLDPWGMPLIVSYHPAYLLRSPAAKARAWQDLLLVKGVLNTDS
ncbi:MAG: uracil-DNA glycosylase [Gammaproteobacteria bacterium]|jgi:DNA polymerase